LRKNHGGVKASAKIELKKTRVDVDIIVSKAKSQPGFCPYYLFEKSLKRDG